MEAKELLQSASCSKALLHASKLAMDSIGNKEGSALLNVLVKDPNDGVDVQCRHKGCTLTLKKVLLILICLH